MSKPIKITPPPDLIQDINTLSDNLDSIEGYIDNQIMLGKIHEDNKNEEMKKLMDKALDDFKHNRCFNNLKGMTND